MKSHQTNQKTNDMIMVVHHFNKDNGIEMITIARRVKTDVIPIRILKAEQAHELYLKLNYDDLEKSKDDMEMYNLVYASPKKEKDAILAINKLHEKNHEWVKLDILIGERANKLYSDVMEDIKK